MSSMMAYSTDILASKISSHFNLACRSSLSSLDNPSHSLVFLHPVPYHSFFSLHPVLYLGDQTYIWAIVQPHYVRSHTQVSVIISLFTNLWVNLPLKIDLQKKGALKFYKILPNYHFFHMKQFGFTTIIIFFNSKQSPISF